MGMSKTQPGIDLELDPSLLCEVRHSFIQSNIVEFHIDDLLEGLIDGCRRWRLIDTDDHRPHAQCRQQCIDLTLGAKVMIDTQIVVRSLDFAAVSVNVDPLQPRMDLNGYLDPIVLEFPIRNLVAGVRADRKITDVITEVDRRILGMIGRCEENLATIQIDRPFEIVPLALTFERLPAHAIEGHVERDAGRKRDDRIGREVDVVELVRRDAAGDPRQLGHHRNNVP